MDLEENINHGWRIYSENRVLGVPFLISKLVNTFVYTGLAAAAFLLISSNAAGSGGSPDFIYTFAVLALGLFTALAATVTVGSYFQVAGLQMALKARGEDKVVFGDSFRAERGAFLKVLLLNLITGIGLLVVFSVFGVLQQFLHISLVPIISLIFGSALLYSAYFAVFTDKNAIESVEASFQGARSNKALAALLYSINTALPRLFTALFLGAALVVASPIALFGSFANLAGDGLNMALVIALGVCFGFFMVSFTLFYTLVWAPLTVQWILTAFEEVKQ